MISAGRTAHAVDAGRMDDEPSYDITVTDERDAATSVAADLIDVIRAALCRHDAISARINLALVEDEAMVVLNEKHLQHTGPTDVLTFDLRDEALDSDGESCQIDGQIVVSVETAAREAAARGHGEEAELALYAVHGTLHLLGYNDADKAEAARMHELEDDILRSRGFGYVYDRGRS